MTEKKNKKNNREIIRTFQVWRLIISDGINVGIHLFSSTQNEASGWCDWEFSLSSRSLAGFESHLTCHVCPLNITATLAVKQKHDGVDALRGAAAWYNAVQSLHANFFWTFYLGDSKYNTCMIWLIHMNFNRFKLYWNSSRLQSLMKKGLCMSLTSWTEIWRFLCLPLMCIENPQSLTLVEKPLVWLV